MQRLPSGLVFKAHKLLYHSTLGSRVIKKKKRGDALLHGGGSVVGDLAVHVPVHLDDVTPRLGGNRRG